MNVCGHDIIICVYFSYVFFSLDLFNLVYVCSMTFRRSVVGVLYCGRTIKAVLVTVRIKRCRVSLCRSHFESVDTPRDYVEGLTWSTTLNHPPPTTNHPNPFKIRYKEFTMGYLPLSETQVKQTRPFGDRPPRCRESVALLEYRRATTSVVCT